MSAFCKPPDGCVWLIVVVSAFAVIVYNLIVVVVVVPAPKIVIATK